MRGERKERKNSSGGRSSMTHFFARNDGKQKVTPFQGQGERTGGTKVTEQADKCPHIQPHMVRGGNQSNSVKDGRPTVRTAPLQSPKVF